MAERDISDYLSEEFIKCYYPGERRLIVNVSYIKDKLFDFYKKYLEDVKEMINRGDESENIDEDGENPKHTFIKSVITLFSFDKLGVLWNLGSEDWDLIFQSTIEIVNNGICRYRIKLIKSQLRRDTEAKDVKSDSSSS